MSDNANPTELPTPTPEGEQKPTPEAKPNPAPTEPKIELDTPPAVEGLEANPVVYDATGNAGLDLALEFIGGLGFGPEHPALTAASDGDFAPLKEAMGKLGDKAKGWERYVKLGEEAYSNQANTRKEADEKALKSIVEAAGGKDDWEAIRSWASANATDAEKVEVNAALKMGGRVATQMVQALRTQWLAKAERDAPSAVKDSARTNATSTEVLTAEAYQKEVAALHRKHRGDLEGRGYKEYEALQHRRIAAMRAGK